MFTREEKRRQRQEEVLLLLDMRLACLLVDKGGSDRLRQHLFLLRSKLESEELLDGETLTAVESTVRALTQQSRHSRQAKARISAMTVANANHIAQAAHTMTSREIAMNRLRGLEWRNSCPCPSHPRPKQPPKIPVLARTGDVVSLTGFFGLALWLRQLSE